ncbi:hypothetical protein OS493_001413 [Desmophyllum pertusum]|uniref:Uncharacterized protein n=1 Tax=Desmophyllum pertusum TaxID=174260 RepID=A0A9W9ZGI5_9CNID|nr:hypothetical protein OS493_001413 [Desmophyllum pertusum]
MQKNGPVAAKLFTWITNRETWEDSDKIHNTHAASCVTEYQYVTLQLPTCDKNMVIYTKHYHNYIGNRDDELSIHVICGDLDVTTGYGWRPTREGFIRNCLDWEEEKVSAAVEPMKPVIQLLQKELGDTVPPITGHFFIWLCCFFSGEDKLLEEHKLSFKDTVRNEKPTLVSVQSVDLLHQNLQAETKFQNLVSEWKNENEQETNYSKMIVETIHLLYCRSETELLETLERDTNRFYYLSSDRELKELPRQLLLDLSGSDGQELKLDTGYVDYGVEPPLPTEQLSPVTELLPECINQIAFSNILDENSSSDFIWNSFPERRLIQQMYQDLKRIQVIVVRCKMGFISFWMTTDWFSVAISVATNKLPPCVFKT